MTLTARMEERISEYYSNKFMQHGISHFGVDWNSKESHEIRHQQLLKVIDLDNANILTLNDLGCGYGALLNYLNLLAIDVSYIGIDISDSMIVAAKKYHKENRLARFLVGSKPDQVADYSVASGIFNVKLDLNELDWINYIHETLKILNSYSSKGFSFNCLSSYSDIELRKSHLFYANPLQIFDYCKKNFSSNVALLHDYGMHDFTIIVRKQH